MAVVNMPMCPSLSFPCNYYLCIGIPSPSSSSPPFRSLSIELCPSLSIVWAKQHSITSNGSYSSWNFNKNTCTASSCRSSSLNLWIYGLWEPNRLILSTYFCTIHFNIAYSCGSVGDEYGVLWPLIIGSTQMVEHQWCFKSFWCFLYDNMYICLQYNWISKLLKKILKILQFRTLKHVPKY